MFEAIRKLFSVFTILFTAAEALAKALLHACTTAEIIAEDYSTEARADHEANMRKRLEEKQKLLAAPVQQ